uniref:Uncharacterized protein n=1 Tax=Cacopsylla melanoneura TaxID=428564 RepID=A0A8D8ZT57_9HEMI
MYFQYNVPHQENSGFHAKCMSSYMQMTMLAIFEEKCIFCSFSEYFLHFLSFFLTNLEVKNSPLPSNIPIKLKSKLSSVGTNTSYLHFLLPTYWKKIEDWILSRK